MRNLSKSRVKKFLAIAILLPLGIIVPFFSVESHYGSSINAQTQDESLKQRVANYKKQLKREIKQNEQDKFKLRCEVAKAKVTNLSTRVNTIQKNRTKAYENISVKLDKIYKRLNTQAFETSKLKANLDELNAKITTFNSQMKTYKTAVDDMKVIDCKDDPASFIAALEVARKSHEQLVTQVDDIRDYITNTVKPTLQQIKEQINDGKTVGGEKQ